MCGYACVNPVSAVLWGPVSRGVSAGCDVWPGPVLPGSGVREPLSALLPRGAQLPAGSAPPRRGRQDEPRYCAHSPASCFLAGILNSVLGASASRGRSHSGNALTFTSPFLVCPHCSPWTGALEGAWESHVLVVMFFICCVNLAESS